MASWAITMPIKNNIGNTENTFHKTQEYNNSS